MPINGAVKKENQAQTKTTSEQKVNKMLTKPAKKLRHYYQYIISAALIMLVILIVYGHDLTILANEALQNEALTHVLLIPFFAAVLLYLKKDTVRASLALDKHRKKAKYTDELTGVILCLIAFLLYWYGSSTFYPLEIHILSLPIFLLGATLILLNLKATLTLLPPILFLVFLVPIPSEYLYTAGSIMANANTQASYTLLKAINMPVALSTANGPPTINLLNPQGQPTPYAVDLACSGVYSLIAFLAFAVFLTLMTTGPLYKKLSVFLVGFSIFEVLNILRITSIISVAHLLGQDVAMNLYHTAAGLLFVFVGMLLTLAITDKVLKIQILPTSAQPQPCPECIKSLGSFCQNCGRFISRAQTRFSERFWIKLLLLLLCSSAIALSINAPTFTVAKGPIGVTSPTNWENATAIFPQIPSYQLEFYSSDVSYQTLSGQDASLWYRYNSSNFQYVYVDVGVSSSVTNLHNWEVCLISWQIAQGQYPLVNVQDQRDTQLLPDVPIVARYLVFTSQDTNQTQVTLYWFEQATFNTGLTVEQKYVRISLLIFTENATNYQQYENELLPIGQAIASYWEPLKVQSLISLGVPAQQALLIVSILFVAFTETAQYSNESKKKINNQKIFNNFASPEEKTLLKTIQELAQTRKTFGTQDIITSFSAKTGKRVKPDELRNTLSRLEEYGFIKRGIASKNDKPTLIWKT